MPADFPAAAFVLSWGATYLIHSTCLSAGVWLYFRARPRAGHALRETLWKTALVGSIVTASAQMLPVLRGSFAEITLAVDESPLPAAAAQADSTLAAASRIGGSRDSTSMNQPAVDATATSSFAVVPETGDMLWISTKNSAGELPTERGASAGSLPGNLHDLAGSGAPEEPRSRFAAAIQQVSGATVLTIIVATALAAVGLGLCRCFWQTWALRRNLARCTAIESGPARRLLDELRRLIPYAPEVRLLLAPDDPEPAALGINRWTIVLPARAVRDLGEDELRALLAHELAHLVRGDSLWLLISRFVCSCLAFQPLNHLARREWQRAAEFLCDSWAVSRTGTPLALARCLAEVAGWRLSGQPSTALLAATGRKSGLADRIERLVESADHSETWLELRHRRGLLLAGGIVLALAAWCFPRVQLALAAADSAERETAGGSVAIDNDAAKPQASGEAGAVAGEVSSAPENAPRAPTLVDAEDPLASDLTTLLSSLDRELSALERDLTELEPLLSNEKTPPQAAALAVRLRSEIVQLKTRRDALRMQYKERAPVRLFKN